MKKATATQVQYSSIQYFALSIEFEFKLEFKLEFINLKIKIES